MLSEVVERKRLELERAKSIRRMYQTSEMSVANIAALHDVPYRTAYNYAHMDEDKWNVFILHKEKLLRDAEERLKAEGGTAEEPEAIEEPKAEEDKAVKIEEIKTEEAEPVKEQLKPWKTKLEEIEAHLMPRKIEPEELRGEPKAAEAEEPERIEAAGTKDFGECEYCGAEILRENARFCWNCGRDVRTKEMRYTDALRTIKGRFADMLTGEEQEALEWAADEIRKRSGKDAGAGKA